MLQLDYIFHTLDCFFCVYLAKSFYAQLLNRSTYSTHRDIVISSDFSCCLSKGHVQLYSAILKLTRSKCTENPAGVTYLFSYLYSVICIGFPCYNKVGVRLHLGSSGCTTEQHPWIAIQLGQDWIVIMKIGVGSSTVTSGKHLLHDQKSGK